MTDYSELKRLAEAIESRASIPAEDEAAWMRRTTGMAVGELLEELENFKAEVPGWTEREIKLIAENERLRDVTSFEDAVACVFDCLKMTAANTGLRDWDDQLEDLAEEVIEYAPRYKKQWKDICEIGREIDQLKAENEALRRGRTDWQAECLKRGFEYVRESDDHYVLADLPEMADLLGLLLGVEVRTKDNDAYEEANSRLNEQVEGLVSTIHAQEALHKDAERYRWLRDIGGMTFSFGSGARCAGSWYTTCVDNEMAREKASD